MLSQKRHDPYAALRHRDFSLYLASHFLVVCGAQMVSMTVGWELFEKTGSKLDLGLIGLALVLPFLLFGLIGGAAADRFDRRLMVFVSTVLFLLGLGGVALLSGLHPDHPRFREIILACLFLMGTGNAFYIPAKQALIRQLVPREDLLNAITWGSGAFQTASILGPAVGGFLLARIPYSTIYTGAIFLEVLYLSVLLSLRLQGRTTERVPMTAKSLVEGFRFIHRTKPILATITLDLFAVLLGGCTALLPVFVKEILHSGPESLGWLRAAPAVGALFMAVFVARTPLKRPGLTLLWAVAGFGLTTIVFGLSRDLWLSLGMMFALGALDNISVIVRGTLVQVLTPDRLLGRVQSVNYLFINSSNELGAFESGVAAHLLGTVPAVVVGGLASIGIVLLVNRLWPQVARLGPLHRAKARA